MFEGHSCSWSDDPRRWIRFIVISLMAAIIALVNVVPGADVAGKANIELLLNGQRIEGTPLAASSDLVFFLGRDGRLWEFHPNEATEYHKTAGDFRSYSANVMRGQLEAEFGQAYEVSGTGHFLVAHPRGQKDYWVDRFEDMYRSFVLYFSVRGFRLSQPPFPDGGHRVEEQGRLSAICGARRIESFELDARLLLAVEQSRNAVRRGRRQE